MTIDLHALTLESGQLVQTMQQDGDEIQIRELDNVRWFHFNSPAIQSAMSLSQPEKLVLPYARTMLAGFMFQPKPTSLLSLGLGGGAFERFFHAKFPALKVQSVEMNPLVIEVCKQFFKVDDTLHDIWQGSAEAYLAQSGDTFDIIFCDIFSHDGVPRCLSDNSFYKDMAARLDKGGVAVINLLVKDVDKMLSILQAAYPEFDTLALIDTPEDKNIILFLVKNATTPINASSVKRLAQDLDVDMPLLQKLIRFIPNAAQQ